jgi:hypothetical protein
MADPKYGIDAEGNLVQTGGDTAASGGDTAASSGDAAASGGDTATSGGDEAAKGVVDAADGGGEEVADRPVTAADRRRFLNALIASDVIGVLVFVGSGLLLPESRTLLLILAALYAVAGVAVYIWMSRTTLRKVEESSERQANG